MDRKHDHLTLSSVPCRLLQTRDNVVSVTVRLNSLADIIVGPEPSVDEAPGENARETSGLIAEVSAILTDLAHAVTRLDAATQRVCSIVGDEEGRS